MSMLDGLTEPVTCSSCGAVSVNGGTIHCHGCYQRALEPFCEETGVSAVKGCCPIHNGDACLMMPHRAVETIKALRELLWDIRDRRQNGLRIPAEIADQGTPAGMNWAREQEIILRDRLDTLLLCYDRP